MQVMRERPYCNTKKALRRCETHLTAARKRLFGHTEQAFPHGGNTRLAMQKDVYHCISKSCKNAQNSRICSRKVACAVRSHSRRTAVNIHACRGGVFRIIMQSDDRHSEVTITAFPHSSPASTRPLPSSLRRACRTPVSQPAAPSLSLRGTAAQRSLPFLRINNN